MSKNFMEIMKHYHLGNLAYVLVVIVLFLVSFAGAFDHRFTLLVFFLAWVPVFWGALKGLKEKSVGSELFFVFAAVVAFIGEEETAMTVVLLVVLVAEYFEHLIEERTEHAIQSLVEYVPTDVVVERNGREENAALSEVTIGTKILVKTGFRVPVDGEVIKGMATINESSVTGESAPKEKNIGDLIFAGTFVESGSVVIEAQKIGENTIFGKIKKLLEEAGKRKAKIQVFADKVALPLTIALILFIGGVWLYTRDLTLIITMLVFGSPIELVLVTPLAIMGAVVASFKAGVLVKGGLALERFSKVDMMIFDKTGTLTIGEPRVVGIQSVDDDYSERDIIRMAAIAEKRSGHVLAKAILAKAAEENIEVPDPDRYNSVSGHGVEVTVGKEHYRLGSQHFIEAEEHGNIKIENLQVDPHRETTHTSFYLASGDKLCGIIFVADEIRTDAKETLIELQKRGIKKLILLSGDRKEVVESVAKSMGIDEAYGEVFPDQKMKMIENFQQQGHKVAMIGDGVNDAPSLKQADVGIAMGAMGMEPAIEASDIALMSNDLHKIVFTHDLSQRTLRTIKQNIILGLGFTHGLGMVLALLHVLNPIQAAFFHAVPDLAIIANSARLIGFKGRRSTN